jgi:hypothetical protein
MLRKEYRYALDAYQFVANRNLQLLQAGISPSEEQLDDERLAAEMVASVRGELHGSLGKR